MAQKRPYGNAVVTVTLKLDRGGINKYLVFPLPVAVPGDF